MVATRHKTLTDEDVSILQDYCRTLNELDWARGENRISLLFYLSLVKDKLEARGLLELVK